MLLALLPKPLPWLHPPANTTASAAPRGTAALFSSSSAFMLLALLPKLLP